MKAKFLEFWSKFVEFSKKHWEIIAGIFVGIFVILKMRPSPKVATVGDVVKVEKDAAVGIVKAEEKFNQTVEAASEKAEEEHEQRVETIKKNETAKIEEANAQVVQRTEENRKAPLNELANNLASSLGANVVEPIHEDK